MRAKLILLLALFSFAFISNANASLFARDAKSFKVIAGKNITRQIATYKMVTLSEDVDLAGNINEKTEINDGFFRWVCWQVGQTSTTYTGMDGNTYTVITTYYDCILIGVDPYTD